MNKYQQPWIGRKEVDISFILLPPFLCLAIIGLFPGLFTNSAGIPDLAWVLLILLIDVAHVYSTLFRTYFDPGAFRKQRMLLTAIPFAGFIAGVLLYSISPLLFWRVLAYVAIFHFIRQQYGFMRVYSRKEKAGKLFRLIDTLAVYSATLYPVLHWHMNGPRNFNWFLEDDLFYFHAPVLLTVFTVFYLLIVLLYLLKEAFLYFRFGIFNLPRFLVIAGTMVSWYFGIVYFNGDMAFTLLNVVSHGIPYMALVWLYGKKHYTGEKAPAFLKRVFSRYGIIIFLGALFLFAFLEEGIWDLAVWKEHGHLFGGNGMSLQIPEKLYAFIVPLLALPQITHYILDGFIWKIRQDDFRWSGERV